MCKGKIVGKGMIINHCNRQVYGQVTLTFRYGREDEEVMGLKFCTEAVVYRAQLYPPYPGADHLEATTSLQVRAPRKYTRIHTRFPM